MAWVKGCIRPSDTNWPARKCWSACLSAAAERPGSGRCHRLNEIAQATQFASGEVDPLSPSVQVGSGQAHVGDVVATRRNERTLLTDRQRMVKNRDRWTVAAVHRDGSLTVDGSIGRVTLPADYVAADVELAYAETSHATQGRTVDRSLVYLDGPTGTSGIYVQLTRGRTSNEAFVVLHDERSAADVVAKARLARATRTLEQHDRPLRRRGHTDQIARAKNEALSLPDRIDNLELEMDELPMPNGSGRRSTTMPASEASTAPSTRHRS